MRRYLLLLMAGAAYGQLYVSPTGSIMARNTVVYVKQDVNLAGNARFYLRSEAQLVQGTTAASTNQGTGEVSVYQEGNATQFTYNYWCSPVGAPAASAGNSTFGITLLHRPTSLLNGTAAVPLSGLDGTANPLGISDNWIYRYVAGTQYSQWIEVGSATTIPAGQGFTMKGTGGTDPLDAEGNGVTNNPGSAQRYDFRGKPNDGSIVVPLAPGASTLTGNPYPSALHVNAFLLDPANSACTGIAYYWEQDKTVNSHLFADYKGGYGAYAPVSVNSAGVYVPATFDTYNPDGSINTTGASSGMTAIQRRYAPVGQGFMIEGAASGNSVTLKNAHRVFFKESSAPNSQFYRSAQTPVPPGVDSLEVVPLLRINTSFDGQFTRQLALIFPSEATHAADRGIDARATEGFPTDIFFTVDDMPHLIAGMPFSPGLRVPMRATAAASATFTFSLLEAVDFFPGQTVYLYDALDASYHDLTQGPYQATLEAGTYDERFEITFTDESLGAPGNEVPEPRLSLLLDRSQGRLIVHNPAGEALSVALYDMSGRKVKDWGPIGNAVRHDLRVNGITDGIYIAKAVTPTQRSSKKVLIGQRR